MTLDINYDEVADIHINAIKLGFLSTLGKDFLALMYQSINESKNGVVIVHRINGEIVGFIAGAEGLGEVYKLMLRSWLKLSLSLMPALFSLSKLNNHQLKLVGSYNGLKSGYGS